MTDPRPFSAVDLEPAIDADERAARSGVAERLIHGRPVPRAGFRAELRAHLRGLASGSPCRARLAVATLALSGGALLALVGIGLAGSAPSGAGPAARPRRAVLI